jgi:transcriptional regulator with GAF, ATPase, and Fis domain
MGKQINHIPQETVEAFTAYSWPGNVRELQNLIERAVIRADNGVLPNPLRKPDARPVAPTPAPVVPTSAPGTFWDSQRDLILQALRGTGWVVGGPHGAAARLGLKRTSLITKMKKLGISKPVRENEVDDLNQHGEREQWWRPAAG